ncbi:MAG: hypothetical protein ACOX2O_08950 [Bdellovibrionota bacterium]
MGREESQFMGSVRYRGKSLIFNIEFPAQTFTPHTKEILSNVKKHPI